MESEIITAKKNTGIKPRVSVVCISYNQQNYIAQAIEGFLQQKINFEIEIIIADDASTDTTANIIKSYLKNHTNIRAVLREKNIGIQNNLNEAMRSARGDYIALCEGDDFWTDENKLQKQVDFLEKHEDYAICFHPVRVFYQNDDGPESIFPDRTTGFTVEELLKGNFIQTNSVMYRRQSYHKLPNDILPLDWYYHLYHAQFGKIGFLPDVMAVYRVHSGGIWHDSYVNIDRIWGKYGVQWLGMYIAVDALFQSNATYRKITEGNIINTLRKMREISKDHPDLILRATSKYPLAVMLYIDNLHEQLDALHSHADKQAELIEHYKGLSDMLQSNSEASHTQYEVRQEDT